MLCGYRLPVLVTAMGVHCMTEHFQWTWGLSPVLVTVNSAAVTIPVPLSGRVPASLVWRC